MPNYALSTQALRDLAGIRRYLIRKEGVTIADRVEDALFAGFEELVRLPWIGHPRSDVRPTNVRFHNVYEYVIMFERNPAVRIVRVVHGARDLPRVL